MQNNFMTYNAQPLSDSAKTFENKKLNFQYYDETHFNENVKNEKTKIIGEVILEKKYKYDDVKAISVLSLQRKDSQMPYNLNVYEISSKKALGYICVEDDTYIKVIKTNLLPFIIAGVAIIAIIGIIAIVSATKEPPEVHYPQQDIEGDVNDWDGDLTQNEIVQIQEQIDTVIPGYSNLFVSAEYPTIKLSNPAENTVYFKYTIYDTETEELLYQTALIPNGKVKEANFMEFLSPGVHLLKFVIECYDIETQAPCNGANQTVKVTVLE